MAQLGLTLATGLMAGGTLLSTVGAIKQGNDAKAIANYNALQQEAQGKAEFASKIQESKQANREKNLMLSRARAVGAASGGGIDIDLMGDIEEQGTMNEATLLWQGEEMRKGRNAQAAVSRFEGLQKKRASLFKAGSTLLTGGSALLDSIPSKTFYERYG